MHNLCMARPIITRTQFRSTPRDVVMKSLPRELPVGDNVVPSVLTLPYTDLAGDRVVASGLSFAAHQRDPWVDLEHGYNRDVGRNPVGWARSSLSNPGGQYSVFKCALPGGVESWVGCTYFDMNSPLQRQVCSMVQDGALPGVSLEFKPDWTVAKSLGRSPIETRDAYEFPRAEVVRWTHCVEPVCPGALTVLKSLPPELDELARVLRDGRVRGETIHPHILKSLARYKSTATLVSVGKAMPDMTAPPAMDAPATAYDPELPDEGMDDSKPALGGVSALYNHAQALLDALTQLEEDMQTSDSPELRKFAEKLKAKGESLAEEAKAMADKHDAKLSGGASEAPADADAEPPADDDEPDMDTDDDGTLKAMRQPYRLILKACRHKRYTLAEIRKGVSEANGGGSSDAQPDPERTKLIAEQAKLQRRLENKIKIYGTH